MICSTVNPFVILFVFSFPGAGNHYAEIQVVEEIYDELAANRMGIHQQGQVGSLASIWSFVVILQCISFVFFLF